MNKKRTVFIVVTILLSIFLSFTIFLNRADSFTIYANSSVSGEYLIQGVDNNYQFKVVLQNQLDNIEVYDVSGKIVDARISKNGNIATVKAPQKGYIEGERYRVTLPEGAHFELDGLQDARSIIFIIKKKEIAIEVLQEDVKDIRESKVVIQSENTALLPLDKQVAIGDILIVVDDSTGQNRALKVTELSLESEGQVVQYESPEEDEIYKELDIYKTYKLNAKDIVIYDDAIISWIEEEGIFDRLFPRVSANSERDIKIDLKQEDDRVVVSVKIFPSKEDLRVGVEIEFAIIMNATMQVDGVMKSNMFINTTLISTVRLIVENKKELFPPGFISVDKANEVLNSLGAPFKLTTPKGKIFGVTLPIATTVNAFIDFDVPISYEMTGGGAMALQGQLDMGIGVVCDQKCEFYTSVASQKPPIPIELVGRFGLKAAVSASIGIEFFWSIKTGIEFENGIYAEIEGLLKSSDMSAELVNVEGYFEFEMGTYYQANAFIYRDGILIDFDFKIKWYETKNPFVTISNSNILQTVNINPLTLKEGRFNIDKLEAVYYNVISRKIEEIPINKEHMRMIFNGNQVDTEDEYYLSTGMKTGENNVTLEWVYNGQKFSSNLTIELKERMGRETLVEALDADEVEHIKGDYWSYKINDKYGIVTSQGKIVAARYDQHFFVAPNDQMCSYRNNNFVGFENDLNNEIECDGFGWSSDDYYYDASKRWMYEYGWSIDMGGIGFTKANFWYVSNQTTEIVQRIIVGVGSTEDYVYGYNTLDEYSLVRISNTGTGYRYTSLTDFDYTEIRKIFFEEEWHYVVREKNGKWGLLDKNGITLINPKYERFVLQIGFNTPQPSLFTVVNNGKYYVIDKNDKILIESIGDESFSGVYNDKFWINRNGKWYIVDIKNQ